MNIDELRVQERDPECEARADPLFARISEIAHMSQQLGVEMQRRTEEARDRDRAAQEQEKARMKEKARVKEIEEARYQADCLLRKSQRELAEEQERAAAESESPRTRWLKEKLKEKKEATLVAVAAKAAELLEESTVGKDGLRKVHAGGALGQAQQAKETLEGNRESLASMTGGYQHIREQCSFRKISQLDLFLGTFPHVLQIESVMHGLRCAVDTTAGMAANAQAFATMAIELAERSKRC